MVEVRVGDIDTSLSWDEWERWVRQGRVPAHAQVRFEPVTGNDWVQASTLESYADLIAEGHSATAATRLAALPPLLTALLVGIQIRIWWSTDVPAIKSWVSRDGVNFAPPIFEDGQAWRLLSSGFLHMDFGHIAMNMLWLAYVGAAIERTFGRLNLMTLYIGSVLGGSVMSMLLKPETPSLGASGGVFGLIAAVTLIGFIRPDAMPRSTRRYFGVAMLPYLVVMFASGLSNPMTDNWAHFGGLVAGAILAIVIVPPARPRDIARNRLVAGVVALVTVVLLTLPALIGPSIAPIADHEIVRYRAPGRQLAPETEGYSELLWDAPIGWRTGTLASGAVGLRSPSPRAQDRGFAVQLDESDTAVSAAELLQSFQATLERTGSDVSPTPAQETTLSGYPALSATFSLGDRRVHWVGAVRGLQNVTAVWEVDERDVAHLQPLYERLLGSVKWELPYALIDARDRVERTPASRGAQRDLAQAEAQVGDVDGAVARLMSLIDGSPSDASTWETLFAILRTHPDAVPDRDALYERALASVPTASMAAMIASELVQDDRVDTAVGLLELSWLTTPRARPVRRGLRRLGRPTDVHTERGLPMWRMADERGVIDPETNVPTPDLPLTLAQASAEGSRIASVEATACQTLADDLPYMSDESAARRLMFLQLGYLPQAPSAERWDAVHRGLLAASEGRAPRWLCEELTAVVAGDPVVTWIAEAAQDTDE